MQPPEDMKGNLADELYGESLQLTTSSSVSASHGVDEHSFENDDGSVWGSSDDESNKTHDLEREWEKRREQFHTIGYRDGIIAGKEAAAQQGFNIGFKQSVLAGYNFGVVRGISSALAFLPDEQREKLIDEQETREKFQKLHECVHAVSTEDALKLFYGTLTTKQAEGQGGEEESGSGIAGSLESYGLELRSLLNESPKIEVRLAAERQLIP